MAKTEVILTANVIGLGAESDQVKVAADQGKCWDAAIKEVSLPKYEKWGAYSQYFAGNVERYCSYWGRGY